MRNALFFTFLALPLLEIALLIKLGQALGFWPVLALVVGTGIAGSYVVRRQGLAAAIRASEALEAGSSPGRPIVEAALTVLAGFLLIAPGPLTDSAGCLLLVAPLRRFLAARIAAPLGEGFSEGPPADSPADGMTIEGEFERLDETDQVRPPSPPARR